MICNVKRSQLDGVIKCPPSKSYTHRAIFLASLAEGKSTIYNPLLSNDTRATISACEKFGARIENNDKRLEINGTREIKAANIDVANSGTSMRIAAAIASLAKGTSILSGDESLSKRPMGSLLKALYLLGAQIDSNDGMPPVTITGTIKGGRVEIPGNVSSQYVSALLIAGGATSEGIMVDIDGLLVSKDYVGYTIETMKRFGAKVDTTDSGYSCIGQKYRAAEFTVPYDMSILALLVAAKVLVGEKMKIDTGANTLTLVELDVKESVSSVYNIEYLTQLVRTIGKSCNNIGIEYGSQTPIKLLFEMPSMIQVSYYLAPRIEN